MIVCIVAFGIGVGGMICLIIEKYILKWLLKEILFCCY